MLVDEGMPVASAAAAAAALVVAMYEEVLVVSASAAGAASATIDEEDEEMAREARSIEELEGNFMMTGMYGEECVDKINLEEGVEYAESRR